MAKTTIPMQRTKKGFSVKMRDIKFPKKDAPKKDEAKKDEATPPPPPAPAPTAKPAEPTDEGTGKNAAPATPAKEAAKPATSAPAPKAEQTPPAPAPAPTPAPVVDKRPPAPRVYTFAEVKARIAADPNCQGLEGWELANNMIESCDLRFRNDGGSKDRIDEGICDLSIKFARTVPCPCGMGYYSTHNFGFIITSLINHLGVAPTSPESIERILCRVPCRVIFKRLGGHNVADCIFLGHFLDDRFIYLKELMTCGANVFQNWYIGK